MSAKKEPTSIGELLSGKIREAEDSLAKGHEKLKKLTRQRAKDLGAPLLDLNEQMKTSKFYITSQDLEELQYVADITYLNNPEAEQNHLALLIGYQVGQIINNYAKPYAPAVPPPSYLRRNWHWLLATACAAPLAVWMAYFYTCIIF